MAKSLEDLIILKRTALRYLLARESKLLALGKKPINKKIAKFVQKQQENNVWSNFCDSLNEDLTRNLNVFEWKVEGKRVNKSRRYRLFSETKDVLRKSTMFLCGGRMSEAPIVEVEQGQLQGRGVNTPSGKAYYSFQGIPYAKPPLGSLRFKAPQPIEPWKGIRDATSEGNVSAQIDPIFAKQYVGDENCLFLNVYTPNLDGSFLPVMVYIHGGGFKFGSGNTDFYGPDFLVEKDVVVVTINYRLGVLGFLSLNTPEVPGNAGMKDVILALQWVKENIGKFGGNPGNLTIFGESAGGAAVSMLTASPLSKNLISKAIIQSGNALCSFSVQKSPIENARKLVAILGSDAETVDDILEFLSSTPAKDIVEAHEKMNPFGDIETGMNSFTIVVEKEFPNVEAVITESFIDILTSGRVAHVPTMIGSTALEFAFERKSDDLQTFIPEELHIERNSETALEIAKEIEKLYFKGKSTGVESLNEYYELLSDKYINIDTHRYVQYLVQATNVPIYYYKFDYVGELNVSSKVLGSFGLKHAMHMDDLAYLFKNDFQKDVEPTSDDLKMRERMVRLWTNFAKTGNPTPEENSYITVTWLPVSKDNLYYLNLGAELSLNTNPDKEKMEFWEDLYNKHFKIWHHPKTNDLEVSRTTENVTQTLIVTESYIQDGGVTEIQVTEITQSTDEPTKIVQEVYQAIEPVQFVDPPKIVDEASKSNESSFESPNDSKFESPDLSPKFESPEEPKTPKDETPKFESPNQTPKFESPETKIESVKERVSGIIDEAPKQLNGNGIDRKVRTSNEIKMVQSSNGAPKDVIRANDPPEDDLPKNIGVNKFVNFFESLGGKK